MTLCSKCQSLTSCNENSLQCNTCFAVLHISTCSKTDEDSFDYLKTIGEKYNCEKCINHGKIKRPDETPIEDSSKAKEKVLPTSIETHTKTIINRLDEVLRNQVTTNNSLEALNNRVIDLKKKSVKEKDKIIKELEYKTLEQNKKSCC